MEHTPAAAWSESPSELNNWSSRSGDIKMSTHHAGSGATWAMRASALFLSWGEPSQASAASSTSCACESWAMRDRHMRDRLMLDVAAASLSTAATEARPYVRRVDVGPESRATAARQEGCNTRTNLFSKRCRLHEAYFSEGIFFALVRESVCYSKSERAADFTRGIIQPQKLRALAWRTPTLHRFRLLGLVEEEVLHAVEHVGVEVLVGPLVQVGRFVQPGGRADAPWRLEGGEGGDAADALRRRAAPHLAEQLAPVVCPRLVVPPGGEQLLVARVASALVSVRLGLGLGSGLGLALTLTLTLTSSTFLIWS